ncbi:Rab family GTPase [Leucothrix arctica]|uniref:GTP-binding protein n=1 Tax=Leucothrix arctica TaxID=1481894 RepID=A0A317CIW2_9GAMM|nr:Rab family GTPase [Leucothrix arctica]PWQ98436.1 GTP-binding protein [Leucothrix arctica]
MLQKKICMLGAFSVGKSSLVTRYVESIFGDKYHTTVGVKISKKELTVEEQEVKLIIWDLAGQDDLTRLRTSYLRGTSGYILVCDGTRPFSLKVALNMHKEAREYSGDISFVLIINKFDLQSSTDWELDQEQLSALEASGIEVLYTSAKTGDGVDEVFQKLTKKMLQEHNVLENT